MKKSEKKKEEFYIQFIFPVTIHSYIQHDNLDNYRL